MKRSERNIAKANRKIVAKANMGAALLNKMYLQMNRNERRKLSELLSEDDIKELSSTGLSYRLIVEQRLKKIADEKGSSSI
jgi:hypothetical protein